MEIKKEELIVSAAFCVATGYVVGRFVARVRFHTHYQIMDEQTGLAATALCGVGDWYDNRIEDPEGAEEKLNEVMTFVEIILES